MSLSPACSVNWNDVFLGCFPLPVTHPHSSEPMGPESPHGPLCRGAWSAGVAPARKVCQLGVPQMTECSLGLGCLWMKDVTVLLHQPAEIVDGVIWGLCRLEQVPLISCVCNDGGALSSLFAKGGASQQNELSSPNPSKAIAIRLEAIALRPEAIATHFYLLPKALSASGLPARCAALSIFRSWLCTPYAAERFRGLSGLARRKVKHLAVSPNLDPSQPWLLNLHSLF